MKLTRKRVIWLGVLLIAVLLMVDGFVPPPAHDVHSAGGEALSVRRYDGVTNRLYWQMAAPTMSVADLKCSAQPFRPEACDANSVYPDLIETPNTLYVVWSGCVDWSGAGAIIPWQGYNVEWVSSSRTLVLHCYTAKPWVYFPQRVYGVAALTPNTLLAVPTRKMGSGSIRIDEDDRLEHLVGDQSSEFPLATAIISG